MSEWNANQYLKFENQRTQPALDLANRIKDCSPITVLDIGCGPGNSTNIVKKTFPNAKIIGIDSSQDMIEKASLSYPDLHFELCDVNSLTGKYDVIFFNACLQWVPDHVHLIPHLIKNHLNDGGTIAVQFPMNGEEPLYKIIEEVASEKKWGFSEEKFDGHGTLTPNEYYNILTKCSNSFQIWETTYYHNLPDHKALVEWVKGTKIRPYLAKLDDERGKRFENEITERAKEVYPVVDSGEVILRFRRFFFTAIK